MLYRSTISHKNRSELEPLVLNNASICIKFVLHMVVEDALAAKLEELLPCRHLLFTDDGLVHIKI